MVHYGLTSQQSQTGVGESCNSITEESTPQYYDNKTKTDMVVFDIGSGSNVELVVSLAHPWDSVCLAKASTDAGYGAKR